MKHKYEEIIQVGDAVKYRNGCARYTVKLIHPCGVRCDIVRDNNLKTEYPKIYMDKLEILEKNMKMLSHKEIEKGTLNKTHREKTNPHKKVKDYMKKPKTKPIHYLVTEFANNFSTDNPEVHSHKVVIGKDKLAEYIIKLEEDGSNLPRVVRQLGREVSITIKREVVIK